MATLGIKINIKDSKLLEQAKMAMEIAQDPIGQQKMGEAAQLISLRNQLTGDAGQNGKQQPQPANRMGGA